MRERKNEGRYSQWAKDKHIVMCSGDLIDPRDIRADVVDDAQKYNIIELRYDANNGQAESLCHVQLGEEDGVRVTEVPFHYAHLDTATSKFETLIKERKIRHNNNPVLNWMISCCRIKMNDKGQVLPDKIKSQSRIDGIAATVLGLSAALSGAKESVYATRGFLSF
jgi:phage terminase large subunit-like protein